MAYRTILLFGPPGSGKGTWGGILDRMPGFYHFSSGAMFRALSPDSKMGQLALSCIRKGELVPDPQAVALWQEHMQKLITVGHFVPDQHCLVLDGLPRTGAQAEMVQEDLDVQLILSLDCGDRDLLVKRLSGRALMDHRVDDANEEIIRNRFEVYDQQTESTLARYPRKVIQTVDVAQAPQQILLDISQALVKHLTDA